MQAPENHEDLDEVISGWGESIAHIDPAQAGLERLGGCAEGRRDGSRRRVMLELTSRDLLHHRVSGSATLMNGKRACAARPSV